MSVSTNALVESTVTEATVTEVVKVKAPTKKEQSTAIFQQKLAERAQGLFASNRDFRAAVISTIEATLGVSLSSAATMYNTAKKEAEAADATIALGRDPKKAVVVKVSTGKRGRPVGSGKKKMIEVVAAAAPEATVVVVEAVTEQVAEAVAGVVAEQVQSTEASV
jgi:hypothetical protein